MEHINVFIMDMPHAIKGYTIKNDDGSYSIFINAHLSHEEQQIVYSHELSHINHDDHGCIDVNQIERIRHSL